MIGKKYILGEYEYDSDIIKQRVKQYNQSEQGQLKRKEWYQNNKEKMKTWAIKYRLNKLVIADNYNLCRTCFKRPRLEKRKCCDICFNRQKEYRKKYKEYGGMK